MIVSVKKASTRFHKQQFHNAYGIQNWLCKNGFCLTNNAKYKVNQEEYESLLKEFVLSQKPEFQKINRIGSLENYTQNNFTNFCKFVKQKYKK